MTATPRFPDLTDDALRERATTMLRRFFGYSEFRPMQADIVTAVLRGSDALVLMPTGGGKSITFQIPALMHPGITIVVSPLLSLMRDQVESLIANGIPAATINSLQSEEENRSVINALAAGHIKLLYISPERILADLPRWNPSIRISLFAIDEAHCISRWGHDFRPNYTRLSELRQLRPDVPIMALTATADRLTRDDIALRLTLRQPKIFISSFDRPNLFLNVIPSPSGAKKIDYISNLIRNHARDTGIVYCLARRTTESVAQALALKGFKVAAYHAALPAETREEVQRRFRDGRLQCVVATVAFGMGIDKSNIRWVVHYNMPSCIESYYQEIGRAGRDGMPSGAIMFYSYGDIITLRQFADQSGQVSVNLEKLRRMQQFAEAGICRRRILLSYFGETLDHDCGNCDVCRNPPQRYDGTIPVKKALSAIVRVGEQAGLGMLIDILRGSRRQDIISHGFDRIKTYGAGRDLSVDDWNDIILQMIQLGLIDIAYDRSNHLTITDYGRRLLFAQEPIMLARRVEKPAGKGRGRGDRSPLPQAPVDPREALRTALLAAREKVAQKEGIAPYMVLSDPAIEAIITSRPTTIEQFAAIEGISFRKAAAYWTPFAKALARADRQISPEIIESFAITHFLFRHGLSPADIAQTRGYKISTIHNHFIDLIANGIMTTAEIDMLVDPITFRAISEVIQAGPRDTLFDRVADRWPSSLVRLVEAIIRSRREA